MKGVLTIFGRNLHVLAAIVSGGLRCSLVRGCLVGVFLFQPLHAAGGERSPFAGTGWVLSNERGLIRLLEFRPDGVFIDLSASNRYRGTWKQSGDAVGAMVKLHDFVTIGGRPSGAEHLLYEARIVKGALQVRSAHQLTGRHNKRYGEYSFTLERERTCTGEPGLCDMKLFCIDPATRKSLTKLPFLHDTKTVHTGSPEKFDDFLKTFSCAALQNISGSLQSRVRFPLTSVVLGNRYDPKKRGNSVADKGMTRQRVKRSDFPKLRLWPAESTKGLDRLALVDRDEPAPAPKESRAILLPPFPARQGRRVMHYGRNLWHFAQYEGRWYLDEVWECRGGSCPESLFCGGEYPTDFPRVTGKHGEDFFSFFRVFYCSLQAGDKKVFSRMRFPLPYDVYHTEGNSKGTLERNRKTFGWLQSCDGQSQPPRMSVTGDTATVGLDWDGTGCGKQLTFKRMRGQWYLVRARFDEY